MTIQINTDKTISGEERSTDFFKVQIADALKRFETHIKRIEVHLKDENGKIIKSAFKENKESLKAEEGQTIEMIEYKGCPYWNKPKVDIDDFF